MELKTLQSHSESAQKQRLDSFVQILFDLVRLFGNVPFIDHTLGAEEYFTIDQVGPESVYPLIISDLEAAIDDLPVSVSENQLGRVTKGAAEALLARVLLFENDESKMGQVASLCESVYSQGNILFLSSFGDIWTKDGEWSSESVFEITYSENSTSDWGLLAGEAEKAM